MVFGAEKVEELLPDTRSGPRTVVGSSWHGRQRTDEDCPRPLDIIDGQHDSESRDLASHTFLFDCHHAPPVAFRSQCHTPPTAFAYPTGHQSSRKTATTRTNSSAASSSAHTTAKRVAAEPALPASGSLRRTRNGIPTITAKTQAQARIPRTQAHCWRSENSSKTYGQGQETPFALAHCASIYLSFTHGF